MPAFAGGYAQGVVTVDGKGSAQISGFYVTDYVTAKGLDWGKYSKSFTPATDGKVVIRLEVVSSSGTVWFDNIRLSSANQTMSYAYDTRGNYVTQSTSPLGKNVIYDNNSYGQVKTVTASTGQRSIFTYDDLGRLTDVKDNADSITHIISPRRLPIVK